MIYTVIADYSKLLPDILKEESGISSPFSLLSQELKAYIREPKNEDVRLSRLGGYLLLFHTVRFLFGKMDFDIAFGECGKPRFTSERMKSLSFNISHSEGLCAITLCDEPSSVGVDIQAFISKEREERMKERLTPKNICTQKGAEVIYLFGGFSAFGDCMFAQIPLTILTVTDPKASFIDCWSLCEAAMKCDGRGFGAFSELEDIFCNVYSDSVNISYKGKKYSVSTAVKF